MFFSTTGTKMRCSFSEHLSLTQWGITWPSRNLSKNYFLALNFVKNLNIVWFLWRWVSSNSWNIILFMSLQWSWVTVPEYFTTLMLCLLSRGNSPGFRTSSCARTRPECPSGSWWRPRLTMKVWWRRRMWSRPSGSRTVAPKTGTWSFVFGGARHHCFSCTTGTSYQACWS